jgi:hypothetical protein
MGVAQAAEKPPYERLLRGEDQKQAAALEKQINDLWSAAKFTEATVVAEKVLILRRRVQGPDHWQAADAARRLETLRQAARLPVEQQRQLAEVAGLQAKGTDFSKRAHYVEAERLHRRALAIHPSDANSLPFPSVPGDLALACSTTKTGKTDG